jgi:hypothetical protein
MKPKNPWSRLVPSSKIEVSRSPSCAMLRYSMPPKTPLGELPTSRRPSRAKPCSISSPVARASRSSGELDGAPPPRWNNHALFISVPKAKIRTSIPFRLHKILTIDHRVEGVGLMNPMDLMDWCSVDPVYES